MSGPLICKQFIKELSVFVIKRKKYLAYFVKRYLRLILRPVVFVLQPINTGQGNWPWHGRDEGGFADPRYRYSLASLSQPRRCVGFVRRRHGRGGRQVFSLTGTVKLSAKLSASQHLLVGFFCGNVSVIEEIKASYFVKFVFVDCSWKC